MADPPKPAAGTSGEGLARLRAATTIRERCGLVLAAAEAGDTPHFALDWSRLGTAADYVIATTRARYPDLQIPYHSRWRHFVVGGHDRWQALAATLDQPAAELARIRFDLVIVSVLLDAGAGAMWRYVDPASGATLTRSEGLAIASLELFARGLCSARPGQPLRADADALMALSRAALAEVYQVDDGNPLVGLDGRIALLRRLGRAVAARPDLFGRARRLGALFDHLAGKARGGRLPAPAILEAVLDGLSTVWPGRLTVGGISLGDVGHHPAARADDASDGLVPFHKLSQWLVYSLLEPLEDAGIAVIDQDRLSALAEYRNGGLLVDLGVLRPRHDMVVASIHDPLSETVVEWRALTVALIDRLADEVRARLGRSPAELPLAKVLEGGTWAAGRRIAREMRPDGGPPIRVTSDGTLF